MHVWEATKIADKSRNGEFVSAKQLAKAMRVLTDAYRQTLEDNATIASQSPKSAVEPPEMKGQWVHGYFISDTVKLPEYTKLDFPHGPIYIPK